MAKFYYRAPSELMHVNDGWQLANKKGADAALDHFREKKGMRLTKEMLQVKVGDRWRFATETSEIYGGFIRKGEGR